jgi:hypothetical protein
VADELFHLDKAPANLSNIANYAAAQRSDGGRVLGEGLR